MAVGAHAFRRTIEPRAAGSVKAKRAKTKACKKTPAADRHSGIGTQGCSPVDVGNIMLVVFTERDGWLAPLDKRPRTKRRIDGWQRAYWRRALLYIICVDAAVGVNGRSRSGLGLTRERWCCAGCWLSRLDMDTCQTGMKYRYINTILGIPHLWYQIY